MSRVEKRYEQYETKNHGTVPVQRFENTPDEGSAIDKEVFTPPPPSDEVDDMLLLVPRVLINSRKKQLDRGDTEITEENKDCNLGPEENQEKSVKEKPKDNVINKREEMQRRDAIREKKEEGKGLYLSKKGVQKDLLKTLPRDIVRAKSPKIVDMMERDAPAANLFIPNPQTKNFARRSNEKYTGSQLYGYNQNVRSRKEYNLNQLFRREKIGVFDEYRGNTPKTGAGGYINVEMKNRNEPIVVERKQNTPFNINMNEFETAKKKNSKRKKHISYIDQISSAGVENPRKRELQSKYERINTKFNGLCRWNSVPRASDRRKGLRRTRERTPEWNESEKPQTNSGVATWAPSSMDETTKPYYEAWVDTKWTSNGTVNVRMSKPPQPQPKKEDGNWFEVDISERKDMGTLRIRR